MESRRLPQEARVNTEPRTDLARLDAQLEALLELPVGARSAEIRRIRESDPNLARLLERLISLTEVADTSALRALHGWDNADDTASPPEIPGYRIVREIGRGGSGSVHEAVREIHGSPQPVAIKVLRAASVGPEEYRRFINEHRILAQLQHPNISTMIDAGVVAGRPYMVLELIRGVPIDRALIPPAPVDAVLDAMLRVLDALQMAHGHLIVHRDIKPANVLLDEHGQLKLIDFGIAKVLDGAMTDGGPATQTGLAPLTLRYASPEQLLARPVGVASDVFQVGLLMYHLLTGAWPWDEDPQQLPTLRTRSDSLPVAPSLRVSDRALRKRLAGDLDSIVLRCLAFEPEARYRSASELSDDIRRHLRNEPVQARRHSRGYLARRFFARHRLAVVSVAALLVLTLAAAAGSVVIARRTQESAARVERVLDTVTDMFTAANPFAASPASTTVAEVVAEAGRRFLEADLDDPSFQAQMLLRLADMQTAYGQHAQALTMLRRAESLLQGSHDALHSRVTAQLIDTLITLGEYDRAMTEAEQALPTLAEHERLKVEHLMSVVLNERGENEASLARLTPVLAQLHRFDALTQSRMLTSHAFLQGRQGDTAAEIDVLREAASVLDPERIAHVPALLRTRGNIATALVRIGRTEEAAAEYEQMLAESRAKLAPTHPLVAKVAANASVALMNAERFEDAWNVFDAVDRATALKEEPGWRAQFLTIRASAALYSGRLEAAHADVIEGLETAVNTLGSGSPRLAYFAEQFAWQMFEREEFDVAIPAALRAHALSEGRRTIGDLILELLAQSGHAIPDRPDPAYPERLAAEGRARCDQVQFRTLLSLLDRAAEEHSGSIPEDCPGIELSRLSMLGLTRPDPAQHPLREPMRSPLMLRWQAAREGKPAPELPRIDAAERDRLHALIARL